MTYKIILFSTIMLMCFVFGTMTIKRGSMDRTELKTISGQLEFYDIIKISGSKQMIDVMTLKIKGYSDKVALYLNSKEEYLPIIEKFKSRQPITVIYNEKGGVTSDSYNLHIYEIDYGKEKIIDYSKMTSTDKVIGIAFYTVGLICLVSLIYVYRKKAAGNTR